MEKSDLSDSRSRTDLINVVSTRGEQFEHKSISYKYEWQDFVIYLVLCDCQNDVGTEIRRDYKDVRYVKFSSGTF